MLKLKSKGRNTWVCMSILMTYSNCHSPSFRVLLEDHNNYIMAMAILMQSVLVFQPLAESPQSLLPSTCPRNAWEAAESPHLTSGCLTRLRHRTGPSDPTGQCNQQAIVRITA